MPVAESSVSRNALVILAVIASGATLYWMSGILTPLALAMFLAVMIDGFARVLQHRLPGISRRAALPLAIVLSLAIFGGSAFFVAENATSFATQLVTYTPKLNGLIARIAALVGVEAPPNISQLFHQLDPTKYLGQVARGLQNFASTAAFVLVYAAFIIASRHGFERKIVGLFATREERQEALAAFLRIRDGVEQYLWVQTVTGAMIAVASWLAMVAVGLNDAAFWAFLIFIASYIPVVGGVVAVAAPPLFALVQFDSYGQAIVLFAVLNVITGVVGNIIYPRMQGRSLNIDPVVVLLALAFWGAIWGLAGAFLSTPLTVMMMVILAQFDGTRWIAVLLSADGDPQQLKTKRLDQAPDEPDPAPAGRRHRKT
ncbi:AI-2E family transporter [Phenylobacterium hankyongense]|uniref:AI-2E family transporter n=1 Tax=Phenylobacterium hankyongense TaxID=1813876 RepID=A0A328B0E1_9CAUL|nr:AI-2E family transporter [Phenylobacterium hankyongense]RAK59396.1 AI-2E family transporter [Phenylobacterium hankyongense]